MARKPPPPIKSPMRKSPAKPAASVQRVAASKTKTAARKSTTTRKPKRATSKPATAKASKPTAIKKPAKRPAKASTRPTRPTRARASKPAVRAAPLSSSTAIDVRPPDELQRIWGWLKNEWRGSWRIIVLAVGIALVVRSCLFQPFTIPSGSMIPSLYVGDYMFVNKYRYGYSAHSFPFSMLPFDGRILARQPQRGDVVVFKLPKDGRTDFVKRIIGLPGDKIELRRGILYLNDQMVPRTQLADFSLQQADGSPYLARQYEEALPNGVQYRVLDLQPEQSSDNMLAMRVPQGQYFVMGDNRDNSVDSRFSSAVGFVPFENLVGRASLIFFSLRPEIRFWQITRYARMVRWERMLTAVR